MNIVHELGSGKPPKPKLYGEAASDPVKFCGNSCGAGKGDNIRWGDERVYKENMEKIFGKKYIKLYSGELVDV